MVAATNPEDGMIPPESPSPTAKFLFTMLPVDDHGLPTRLLPVARILTDRCHNVAIFNPAPAPAKLIEETGPMRKYGRASEAADRIETMAQK
jgi:hypothetical protein